MKRPTLDTIAVEIAALTTMTTPQLQARWKELYRIDPPRHVRAGFLRRAIAHRLQEMVFGQLDPASRRKLRTIARELARRDRHTDGTPSADSWRPPASLAPGSRLVREWKGVVETVEVVEGGFIWKGKTHPNLSAVAFAITGTKWSGPRFFGLARRSGSSATMTSKRNRASAETYKPNRSAAPDRSAVEEALP